MKKLQWGQGLVLGAFGWMRCRALADRPSSHITKGITRSPHHLLINLKAPWAWQALCAAALQLILLMPSAAQAATPMISAGSRHSMALKSDGTVVVWGDNLYGQSTIPPGLTDVVSVAAGSLHSLALKADGTVAAWGWNDYGQTTVPAGLSGVIRVSAGSSHSMALKSDGTVVAWGGLYSGSSSFQVPIAPPSGLSNVVAISAGSGHSLALKSDGSVAAWGYSTFGQNTIPSGLSNVTQVSDEGTYSMSLKADGTVVAWGISSYVRTAFLATLSNVASVSAGELHALALKTDGTVVAWGSNSSYYTICCGVTSSFYTGQSVVPPGLNNVVAISAGGRHSLALKADGTVVAWGSNSHANSGIPTTFTQTGESSVPVGLNLNPQKTSQTIVFHIAPTLVQGGDVAVSATASSGLPVIFSSITNNTCTISGSTVTGITVGTCTLNP